CVSAAQADKVGRAGVPAERLRIIRNATASNGCHVASCAERELLRWFPAPPRVIVGAAGRLSPEKGFDVLVEAAALCRRADPSLCFVFFVAGPRRPVLQRQIAALGLQEHFILAGFHSDWTRMLPY